MYLLGACIFGPGVLETFPLLVTINSSVFPFLFSDDQFYS